MNLKSKVNAKWMKTILIVLTLSFALLLTSTNVLAQVIPAYQYNPFPYYGVDPTTGVASAQYYFGGLNSQFCQSGRGQDFLVQVLPGSCSPGMVRSDLLAEQPVPVFCKLTGLKVNPLIEVPNIKSISVAPGEVPAGVRTVVFHPNLGAVKTNNAFDQLIGTPINNDLGYAVVVLNPIAAEKDMPKSIQANLTARITYDLTSSFGITNDNLIIPVISDDAQWQQDYKKYTFWEGRGYVRATNIQENSAQLSVYVSADKYISTFTSTLGNSYSPPIYMPGTYCAAGLQVKLENIILPQKKATFSINGNKIDVINNQIKILDGRCTVNDISPSVYGNGGSASIVCPEGTFRFNRPSASVQIQIDSVPQNVALALGDVIKLKDKSYSIVFAGKHPLSGEITADQATKVLILKENSSSTSFNIGEINRKLTTAFSQKSFIEISDKNALLSQLKSILATDNVEIIINSANNIGGSNIDIMNVRSITQTTYSDLVENYYKAYTSKYEDVVKNYPSEKISEGDSGFGSSYYGEEALWEAASTTRNLGKSLDELKVLKQLVSTYPKSEHVDSANKRIASLYSMGDSTEASKLISTGGKSYYVTLEELTTPQTKDVGTALILDGAASSAFGLNDIVLEQWQITDITERYVSFNRIAGFVAGQTANNTVVIAKGDKGNLQNDAGKHAVLVEKINVQKYAIVSVHPFSNQGETNANFTINIGIEKRAIQLSPEQTKKLIGQLDRTIGQFQDVTTKLGKVVESWKKVCLAGSAALWAENFFENIVSGEKAIARQFAMREALIVSDKGTYKGYSNWCADSENQASLGVNSLSKCLFAKKDEIDKISSFKAEQINGWNDLIEKAKTVEGVVSKKCTMGVICRENINQSKMIEILQKNDFSKYNLGSIASSKGDSTPLTPEQVTAALAGVTTLYNSQDISLQDAQNLDSQVSLYKECTKGNLDKMFCSGIRDTLYTTLAGYNKQIESNAKTRENLDSFKTLFGTSIASLPTVGSTSPEVSSPIILYDRITNKAQFEGLTSKENLALMHLEIKDMKTGANVILGDYAVAVTDPDNTKTGKVYKLDASASPSSVEGTDKQLILGNVGKILGRQTCNYAPTADYSIKFWGSGPYSGFPAIIPLGKGEDGSYGWYAATKAYADTLQIGLSTTQAYADSGQPQNFYIANIGPNQQINFGDTPGGDDQCSQYFALGQTYTGQTELGSMTPAQTQRFVNRAQECIRQVISASKGANPGQTISTQCGNFPVGQVKSPAPATTCEDFMSPEKCTLLYNMCDPVICPSSRCNLGGKYQVDNVIQTGIIGGLALCAPNFGSPTEGGVAVPVCLTGVYAGLQNLVSVLNDTRKCLQESLNTGRSVGICNELQSVYLCEFFWRELTPFIKTGVPQLIERTIYNRNSGGGEYLTFAQAYQSSVQQFSYFTNYYGANALNAFQVRNTAEAGTLLCKAFVGLRYPNSANLFDELAKPESPVQINAWFDEIPYSSVTVPSTSQYKIYWHIFAGADQPAYWTVYLTQPASIPTVNIPEQYIIQTGFTGQGQSADVTRDLTGPAGYKQLCVRINLKDYCGFKKVSTGFATNELTNLYVQSQTTPNYAISTEADCTSGISTLADTSSLPASLLPLITQPGMGGLTESLQPSIYKRGITRICSSDNPGKATSPGRWNLVGFCDSQKKVGCWLDSNSVKAAINDLGIQNATLSTAQQVSNELLVSNGGYLDASQSQTLYNGLKVEFANLSDNIKSIKPSSDSTATASQINSLLNSGAVIQLNRIISSSISPREKARATLKLAEIYLQIVLQLRGAPALPAAGTAVTTPTASAESASKCEIKSISLSKTKTYSGDTVDITVKGNTDCAGVTSTVKIIDQGFIFDSLVAPISAVFDGQSNAKVSWKTKMLPGPFYIGAPTFVAKVSIPGKAEITSPGFTVSDVFKFRYIVQKDSSLAELASKFGYNAPSKLSDINPCLVTSTCGDAGNSNLNQIKKGFSLIIEINEETRNSLGPEEVGRLIPF